MGPSPTSLKKAKTMGPNLIALKEVKTLWVFALFSKAKTPSAESRVTIWPEKNIFKPPSSLGCCLF